MMKYKQQGLVADLMPNIRLMQMSGHFMFQYYNEGGAVKMIHQVFSVVSHCTKFIFDLLVRLNMHASFLE